MKVLEQVRDGLKVDHAVDVVQPLWLDNKPSHGRRVRVWLGENRPQVHVGRPRLAVKRGLGPNLAPLGHKRRQIAQRNLVPDHLVHHLGVLPRPELDKPHPLLRLQPQIRHKRILRDNLQQRIPIRVLREHVSQPQRGRHNMAHRPQRRQHPQPRMHVPIRPRRRHRRSRGRHSMRRGWPSRRRRTTSRRRSSRGSSKPSKPSSTVLLLSASIPPKLPCRRRSHLLVRRRRHLHLHRLLLLLHPLHRILAVLPMLGSRRSPRLGSQHRLNGRKSCSLRVLRRRRATPNRRRPITTSTTSTTTPTTTPTTSSSLGRRD